MTDPAALRSLIERVEDDAYPPEGCKWPACTCEFDCAAALRAHLAIAEAEGE